MAGEYNQYIDPALLQILASRRLGLNEQAGTSRTRVGEDYQSRERGFGIARERGTRDINEGFASRGLFSSGIRLNELGEFEQDMARQIADSVQGRDRSYQDIESALRAGLLGIESEETQAGLAGYNQAIARQLAEQQASSRASAARSGGGSSRSSRPSGGGGGGRSTPTVAAPRHYPVAATVAQFNAQNAGKPGGQAAYQAAASPRPKPTYSFGGARPR